MWQQCGILDNGRKVDLVIMIEGVGKPTTGKPGEGASCKLLS